MAEAVLSPKQMMALGVACRLGFVTPGRAFTRRTIWSLEQAGLLQERRYSIFSYWEPTPDGKRRNRKGVR